MDYYRCLDKIKDEKGSIKYYTLLNLENNEAVNIEKTQLKRQMIVGSVTVTNLKLNKQDRMINKSYYDTELCEKQVSRILNISDTDKRLLKKASVIGNISQVDNYGRLIVDKNSSTITITPNVEIIHEIKDLYKKIIILGDSEIKIKKIIYCMEIQLYNASMLKYLENNKIDAYTIFLMMDNLDENIIDSMFNIIKVSYNNVRYAGKRIIINPAKLDKEVALNKVCKLMERDFKKITRPGVKMYHCMSYIQLLCCLTISYKDKIFMAYADKMAKEFKRTKETYIETGKGVDSNWKYRAEVKRINISDLVIQAQKI